MAEELCLRLLRASGASTLACMIDRGPDVAKCHGAQPITGRHSCHCSLHSTPHELLQASTPQHLVARETANHHQAAAL
jgi:hypothetical protein